MARPNEELLLAWSSLSGDDRAPGWYAITLAAAGPIGVEAGRRSPDNTEAILISFPTAMLTRAERLPGGQGFLVERADSDGSAKLRLALTRQSAGSTELFTTMACDVIGAIDEAACAGAAEVKLLQVFIQRVFAWQRFMSRGALPLAPEAELGLAGELIFMAYLIQAGLSPLTAVESWLGPDDAPQDFVIGDGAIEVKATLSTAGFPAKIGSLEQLDNATVSPLFLGAVRFARAVEGATLPAIVSDIESFLAGDPAGLALMRQRLLSAGYLESHAVVYTRTFKVQEILIYGVTPGFPRLTTGSVPVGISRAVYEIDLEHATSFLSDLPTALRDLGVSR